MPSFAQIVYVAVRSSAINSATERHATANTTHYI